MRFEDPAAAERAIDRLGALTLRPMREFVEDSFRGCSHPDQALSHLERWLRALSNPGTVVDALAGTPALTRLLVGLLGASHQMADLLAQNPELSDLVLDPSQLAVRPSVSSVVESGSQLLLPASSYTHRLDRLRYLKQVWMVRIAVADLDQLWPAEQVWRAHADVAEGLLRLAHSLVWDEFAREKGLPGGPPIAVVGFGKLGGYELNASSDIDLAFVVPDDAPTGIEQLAVRYGERLSRALSDRMGRGSLYRVDLRLRPYGARGALVNRMRAVQAYYERYAEPWEHLALIRSRVVAGSEELARDWEALRQGVCFQPQRGEWFLDDLLKMRERVEQQAGEDDLKRGVGGIRDVEFLCQTLQMLHGREHESLRVSATCEALRALAQERLLDERMSLRLQDGYTFLRQVEHRCQLLGDQQTHRLPPNPKDRRYLALRMGFAGLREFEFQLEQHRSLIRHAYASTLRPEAPSETRTHVLASLGRHSLEAASWFDSLEGSEAYYFSLHENESSIERVRAAIERAPAMMGALRRSSSLTEAVMSGEVLETLHPQDLLASRQSRELPAGLARALHKAHALLALHWVLSEPSTRSPLGWSVSELYRLGLVRVAEASRGRFDLIALGSLASGDIGIHSDCDLLFLANDGSDLDRVEAGVRKFLTLIQEMRTHGSPITVDLRLRPEGRQGRLVRTYEGFERYERESMEPWERFALGRASLVLGDPQALLRCQRAAYGTRLTRENAVSLLHIKRRIENERLAPAMRNRDLKLGHGGTDDLDWAVQLTWMGLGKTPPVPFAERCQALESIGELDRATCCRLMESRQHLVNLRVALQLAGVVDNAMPDPGDILATVAEVLGYPTPDLLVEHTIEVRTWARRLFEETASRLSG